MASVGNIRKSQYRTACFRDENGREHRITTKETNSKKALQIAEELESAVKDWRILTQGQKVLDQLNERFSGPDA
jgi:hypothetical protein